MHFDRTWHCLMEHGVFVDNLKIEPVCKSLFEPDPILLFGTSMKLDLGLINNFEMWDRGGQVLRTDYWYSRCVETGHRETVYN